MTLKRVLRSALAVVLAVACLALCACSTPAVAMTVGGKTYEMGDYLAYAYGTALSDYNSYVYLSYYGEEALDMDMLYGEGDNEEEVPMKEYLIRSTRDMMIRQKALEDMMAEMKIEWNKEDLAAAEEDLKELEADAFISRGFTNERYIKMYKATTLNESSLFDGLYNKGGQREVAETEIRKFFDENYLSYYMFEISLVDDKNTALSDEIITDYKARFDAYLNTFNKSDKTAADFNKIYQQYLKDTEEEDEETTTTGTGTTTSAATTTSTTTAATTTTEATTTTTTASSTDSSTGSSSTATTTEEKTVTRSDVVKVADGVDEELCKAVETIKEGEAGVVTYKQGGTKNTLALIFRMDPEADRGKDKDGKEVNYYEDSRDQTLQHMKYDEFDAEVKKRADALMKDAVINERALNAVDFTELVFGQS